MGLIGLLVGCSSEQAPGSMGGTDFMDMSTTVSILVTGTTDHCRHEVNKRSTISTLTRRSMSMAIPAIPAMTEAANMRPASRGEAIPGVGAIPGAAVIVNSAGVR
jgi:hypothetical protein